jgi:putative membrane protein
MLSFSKLISWIFLRYKNTTISILTGFIFGSLAIIWPWKKEITMPDFVNRHGEEVVLGYSRYFPVTFDSSLCIALLCILIGAICIWSLEKLSKEESK